MGVYESLPVDAKRFGFRIYNLSPNGPLHQAGVKEFSDFLIPPDEVYENKKPFSRSEEHTSELQSPSSI